MRVHPGVNDRTLRNWLVQATAADMLRVALIYLVRAGIQVDAVVHDAVLIECDTDALATVLPRTQAIMAEASRRTLRGRLTLRTDAVVIPPGTRYPSHGADLWNWTMAHIGRPDAQVTPEPLRRPAIENPVAVGGTA